MCQDKAWWQLMLMVAHMLAKSSEYRSVVVAINSWVSGENIMVLIKILYRSRGVGEKPKTIELASNLAQLARLPAAENNPEVAFNLQLDSARLVHRMANGACGYSSIRVSIRLFGYSSIRALLVQHGR